MVTRQTSAKTLSGDELAALRALRPAFNVLMRGLDADLVRVHGIAHTEFLALMSLAEAEGRTMRLSDIAEFCQQSVSAISRTVVRLEAAGWVRRQQDPIDGRGLNATLTEAGLVKFEQAHASHVESVRRRFFAHLGDVDLHALGEGLRRVAEQNARAQI
jgi:DNA-binding MarR family transcriptional regulator